MVSNITDVNEQGGEPLGSGASAVRQPVPVSSYVYSEAEGNLSFPEPSLPSLFLFRHR